MEYRKDPKPVGGGYLKGLEGKVLGAHTDPGIVPAPSSRQQNISIHKVLAYLESSRLHSKA